MSKSAKLKLTGSKASVPQSAGRENDLIERISVAYVDALVTAADLYWRQITGQDVGIDGIIESRRKGSAFVQVKGTTETFRNSESVFFDVDWHDEYWLTRGLPIVVCLVELHETDNIGLNCHWIDYRRARREKITVRTHFSYKVSEVDLSSPQSPVFKTNGRDQSQSDQLKLWMEQVLPTPEASRVEFVMTQVDELIENGRPSEGLTLLGNYIGPDIKGDLLTDELVKRVAKANRRLGSSAELSRIIESATSVSSSTKEILKYEQGFLQMLESFRASDPAAASGWEDSASRFLDSFPNSKAQSKEKLIAYTALVHNQALRRLRDSYFLIDVNVRKELEDQLEWWLTTSKEDLKEWSRRVINARLSLCRSYAADDKEGSCQKQFDDARKLYETEGSYHTLLWTAHFMLVQGLIYKLFHQDRLVTFLEDLDLALTGLMRDPEIASYRGYLQ